MQESTNTVNEKVMELIKKPENANLVASELGDLFANYIGDSLFKCVFDHFLLVVEDEEVKDYLTFSQEVSKKHLHMMNEIYKNEKIPAPVGFGEQDVRKDAPRLFSDVFMVFYVTEMARSGLITYASSISTASRNDVTAYFEMCFQDTLQTFRRGIKLLKDKGLDLTSPTIPYPKGNDFVEKKSFISAITGKLRPLTALEIMHLQLNIETNTLGKALLLGFSQVASSSALREYFKEGSDLAEKQVRELSRFLRNDYLPSPTQMGYHVTDSTIPPFSDKLMLYNTTLANAIGIQNYGLAFSNMMRHDIHAQFAALTAGISKYSNKGFTISIENGWLEEPPTAADRDKLISGSAKTK
ncbi:DUF3231 family protein [Halobacillus andaensis]|uniref:DUF3231 family protein n=1 Tax=Halobacillus andaensis TaxID=1176239 RepID=UPI003D747F36